MPSEDNFAGIMGGIIEAGNHQASMALELTKLIVAKSADQTMTEDKIFSTFKRASKEVSDNFPLKSLLEQ